MQRYGTRIQQVMLSADWYRENMPRFKAAFEDGAIELPRDADILADHRALVMDKGVAHVPERRTRGTGGKPRHGDSAIAAALAYYASQLSVAEIAYLPAPRRRAGASGYPALPQHADDDRAAAHRGWSGAGAW
jgi:phage FluMu gp28-like protein